MARFFSTAQRTLVQAALGLVVTLSLAGSACAAPVDACSLLTAAELAELGVAASVKPVVEQQPGAVQACIYRMPDDSAATRVVSVVLSATARDRVLQFRALMDKASSENTREQLEARGEFNGTGVVCKVVAASQLETSQCLGTTEQTIVALALSRQNLENRVAYPAERLKLISTLVSRVVARGG